MTSKEDVDLEVVQRLWDGEERKEAAQRGYGGLVYAAHDKGKMSEKARFVW